MSEMAKFSQLDTSFSRLYGQAWSAKFGNAEIAGELRDSWCNALEEFSLEAIAMACDYLPKGGTGYDTKIPNITEFKAVMRYLLAKKPPEVSPPIDNVLKSKIRQDVGGAYNAALRMINYRVDKSNGTYAAQEGLLKNFVEDFFRVFKEHLKSARSNNLNESLALLKFFWRSFSQEIAPHIDQDLLKKLTEG